MRCGTGFGAQAMKRVFSHVSSGYQNGQDRVVPIVPGNQLDAAKVVLLAGSSKFLHSIHVFANFHWLKIGTPRPLNKMHNTMPNQ